ncbi:tetratricopeptide-like helical domain-containing protein [Heterostelium album PN500]|uniref:Tetratricopeptide-like helical domain-containing protein n=1 Tax=Heterostelium pallidum (strain ATCC 26659 / Pp 5 / PN500) TaxID=670386 RepID=D3BAB7_HETP5|nr:tetratricopeptide-like helical domain-containing protein [Heterostelium album PN500]EFA81504.1 tetratricopeptide-like helical domain-containing protein [Heterostelium album PN500]|eukprot:XP_020433621.1 tetratricopeptide-like helical domain-containing protein [Heterostelium album PN500]
MFRLVKWVRTYKVSREMMESIESIRKEAIKCYQNANYSESIKLINKIIQSDRNDLTAISNRATCHYKLELYQHCIKDCDTVLASQPNNRLMIMRRSMAMSNVKSLAEGAPLLIENAIEMWGDFEITDLLMMNHHKSCSVSPTLTSRHQQQQLEESINFFAASSQPPTTPTATAAPPTPESSSFNSNNNNNNNLSSSIGGGSGGGGYSELRKSTSAEELNDLLEQLSTENFASEISKGNYMVNSGLYEEAIQLFTLIINSNPLIPSAYLGRGTSNAITGNLDDAIYDFSKVIELDNTMGDAYKRRGQSRVAKGMDFEALEDFNQAAIFDRDNDSDIYYQRGLLHYQMRNYERALKDFRKVVEFDRRNKLAWNRVGLCLNIRGFPREAFDAFDRAIELDSQFEAAFTNVGQCWKEIGDYDRSYDAFTQALSIAPNYSNALHLRGILFFNSGKHLQAIQDWTDFLDQDSTIADLRQLRAISNCSIGKYRDSIVDFNYIVENNQLHYSYYQREIALFTHHRLDTPLNGYNMDRLMNVYIKTFLCQRVAPSSLVGYNPQAELSESIVDVDLNYKGNESEQKLIDSALRIGRKLQYDCEGFLPNKRQHLQCGLAAIDIAQTLKKIWNQNNGYMKANSDDTKVEINYKVDDTLIQLQNNNNSSSTNNNILNELSAVQSCKDLYRVMKKDFFVVTPCYSSYRPNTVMEGTRLTLQFVYPEGYEFAIRTPCTPERWQLYDQEMTHIWNELCSSVYKLKNSYSSNNNDSSKKT